MSQITSFGSGALPPGAAVTSLNGLTNAVTIGGTANQITVGANVGQNIPLALPTTLIGPGTIASTGLLTAGNGLTVTAGATTLTPLSTAGVVINSAAGLLSTTATTVHCVQLGTTGGQLSSLANGTTGQVLTAVTGGDPTWSASSGGVSSITGTANQITASASTGAITLSIPSTFIAPGTIASTTSLAAGNLTTAGIVYNTVTSGILTSHQTTNHAIQVGNGSQLTDLALGTQYQVLQSGGVADPAWSAYTLPATVTTGSIFLSSSTSAVAALAIGANNTILTSNGTTASWAAPSGGGVSSITGTANQITASASTGAVTLSIPSTFIAPGSVEVTSGFTVDAGTTGITGTTNINTSGNATTTIGNTAGSAAVTINVGTGNFVLDGTTNSTITMGASLTTGTITLGGTAETGTMTLGSSSGTNTVAIGAGAGITTVNIANGVSGNTISLGNGVNTSAQTINIANGAAAANSTVNILTGAGTVGTQTLNILGSGATRAGAVNIGTGAAAHTIAIGSSSGTGNVTIGNTTGTVTLGPTGSGATFNILFSGYQNGALFINSGGIVQSNNLTVSHGGTGAGSFTAYSVICGGTTSTGAFQNVSGVGTAAQVLTSNGAGALPTWQAAGSGGFTWSIITADQTASTNNGYICNKASALVLTLPTASSVGDYLRVTGINTALGWKIAQAASQQIFFGTSTTTSGTSGSLQSSATRDAIELVCLTANLTWQVLSSIGNITIV